MRGGTTIKSSYDPTLPAGSEESDGKLQICRFPGRYSKRVPPEYKCRTLPQR